MYFLKTPVNEWEPKKAFTEYLMVYESKDCIDQMKKDLTELKNSNVLGVKMKTKCEQFLLLIDKKKSELSPKNKQTTFHQHDNQTINNNFNSTVNIDNTKRRGSASSSAAKKHKTKAEENNEKMEQLFGESCSSTSTLNLPPLPTRIEDLQADDFDTEIKEPYIINDVNVNTCFTQYQKDVVMMNNRGGLLVECNPHELLAVNNVLLLKAEQHSDTLLRHFSPDTLNAIERDIKSRYGVKDIELNKEKKEAIDGILKALKKGEINSRQAARQTVLLQSSDPDFNNTDAIIMGVCNLMNNIPKQKFNGLIRENVLISSYAHSILSPMFNDPDHRKYLIWSNTKLSDESSRQPDVVCKLLHGSNWSGFILVGEVKGEDQKEDKHICLLDLIRIGSMSAASINANLYDGILGVHIVGLQVSFYITSLVGEGLYIMMEICSFPFPRDQTELQHYVTHFDDLLMVLQYSEKCVVTKHKEDLQKKVVQTITTPEFDQFISISKDRKRECPIVYHH